MATNRQTISDVVGELKKLNIDDRQSNRLILSRLKDKAKYYIKQDLDSRRLFKITNIWKRIKCLNMKQVDFMECGFDIPHCFCLMKSIDKLPDSYDSNYGTLVKAYVLNGSKEYIQTTLGAYKEIKRREYNDPNTKYFWIEDGHVFVPDSDVVAVTIVGLFQNPHEVDKLNGEKEADCSSPLDAEFPCPDHILKIIKEELIMEIAKIHGATVEDEKGDLNTNRKD